MKTEQRKKDEQYFEIWWHMNQDKVQFFKQVVKVLLYVGFIAFIAGALNIRYGFHCAVWFFSICIGVPAGLKFGSKLEKASKKDFYQRNEETHILR